ncbi:hypothetical protein D3C73_1391970 [compost metagenome]
MIATIHAQLTGKLLAKDDIILTRLEIGLLHIDQIRRKRIFLRRVDAQHHANRYAARALQNHITGCQRGNTIDTAQLHRVFRQLLRVQRTLL